eukprot:scaffold207721_cov15-Tisochrysis_lutea.AAC.1
MADEYDLVTIGAGSGGVRASRVSAQLYGAKVACVELPFGFIASDDVGGAGGTPSRARLASWNGFFLHVAERPYTHGAGIHIRNGCTRFSCRSKSKERVFIKGVYTACPLQKNGGLTRHPPCRKIPLEFVCLFFTLEGSLPIPDFE